ncbi:MAG: hypothetical protein Q8K34_11805 [Hydrogenophaga sp.]|nr:hypothetical protein [Hydrogenophaga sp.]MDP2220869.1 hypothetical protein [Hydrogenophaga sp.]MDZ4239325.1 hypothetical protein [Hydrogenophaga sp.]
MTSLPPTPRPGAPTLARASAFAALLLLLVFAAAWWTRDLPLFALTPPGGGAADMLPSQRQDLHTTFFTIWAALILVVPALCLLPFRHRSAKAADYWLAFWTVSLLVFLVHFYWAVVVVFGNDWSRILNTPRVTVPRLDTVFAAWWVADVLIAWLWRSEALWVRVQRWGVHALALLLFFMGAAREGELAASRTLGWLLGVAVVVSAVIALQNHRRARTA